MYKVLIVDDEQFIRERVAKQMPWNSLGFEVAGIAESGEKACEWMKHNRPHVMLTDIRMAGMDGLELIGRIRRDYPDVKTTIMSVYDDFKYAQEAMRFNVKGYLLKPVICSEFSEMFVRIANELKREAELGREMNAAPSVSVAESGNGYIERAKRFIQTNYAELIRLEDVADHIYLNANYLSSLFRRETGYSVIDYINEYRIGRAMDLLLRTEDKIVDISLQVGFSNCSYFSKVFKRITKMLPHEYRESRGGASTASRPGGLR